MAKKKKIVLITRTWSDAKIINFIKKIIISLDRIIILINSKKEKYGFTENLLIKSFKKEELIKIDIINIEPWIDPSGTLNIGLEKAFEYRPTQIMVASKEVDIEEVHIDRMSKELLKNKNLLVVGYCLQTNLKELKKEEEKGHYLKSNSWALKTPWNTCAIWDNKLFQKYVGYFNPICDYSKYLDPKTEKLKGMEDTLAIALAIKKNKSLKFGLIKSIRPWNVNANKIKKHIEKMQRKTKVYKKYCEIFSLPNLSKSLIKI